MRKLTVGNKNKFIVFALIVIIILIILILFLNKMLNAEKEQYEISKDIFLYDNNYEHINLTKDAIITKKWTGKYYLSEPETGLSYDLGKANVGYDTIKNKLNLFGDFYEVSLDGGVTKQTKNTEVSDILNPKLYKIDDREYLIVGKNITIENSNISAENYLIVLIDKAGNTLLLNNMMDVKTINAITLQTDTFKFDVANEKLIVNDAKIDLTKIIGSTNEYKKGNAEQEVSKEEEPQEGTTYVSVGGSTANSYNSSNAQAGAATVINNNSGGGQSTSNSKPIINATKIIKSINLRSVDIGPTYLNVNYFISDPESKYQVVQLYVTGSNYSNTIALDKTLQTYRIEGLKANTEYEIAIGYRIVDVNNKIESGTEDVINVRTSKLQEQITITKISYDKVYFNLKLDNNYIYDSAKMVVYIDGMIYDEISEKDLDISSAISTNGWAGSISKPTDGSTITLKLEGAKYNGKSVNTELQVTSELIN